MTSSKSNVTDTIENRSLPSVPTYKGWPQISTVMQYIREGQLNFKQHRSQPHMSFPKHYEPQQVPEKGLLNIRNTEVNKEDERKQPSFVYRGKTSYDSYSMMSAKNSISWTPKKEQDMEEENISSGTKPYVLLPKLLSIEADFLQLVKENNVDSVEKFITDHPKININCTNYQGISALNIAVQNRSVAMVEFLLKQPNVDVGDTVLHAVRDNSIKILVMLLDHQKKNCPGLEFTGTTHSAVFPSYVTPLILAAQYGLYEVVVLLLNRGHTIIQPHKVDCGCVSCSNLEIKDDLYTNSARLSAYKALSSPVYLIHLSSDPILTIFQLTTELCDNAAANRQLGGEYLQMRDDVSEFAVDLIACCRTSEEVEVILKQTSGCCVPRSFVLPRLLMAVDYKQREFVAHPNTQQELLKDQAEKQEQAWEKGSGLPDLSLTAQDSISSRLTIMTPVFFERAISFPLYLALLPQSIPLLKVLESYWIEDWHSWRRKSIFKKSLILLSRIFVIPIILLMCSVAPQHRLVRHWQIPLNKLITHAASYFVFLGLVFYISNQDKSTLKRGPPNTGFEVILILYVCGYFWSSLRMCMMQGPRRYLADMWNWAEIVMLGLFSLTFYFWMKSAIDIANNGDKNLERKYWDQYDPTLLAEGTFCLATIFAFFRLMYLCQLNYHLGPLQVSLGKMTIDIYKYGIVFGIIICAFAAGLARFYQYYDGMVYEDEFGMKTVQVSSFTNLSDTLKTLFWALFCMAPLESADVVLENTRDPNNPDKYHENRHGVTERIGYFCFGCFEVILVIVVLNMLIATMSNTFQRVTDNVAIEWTFRRTEVYIQIMMQTTLPSPFNLIPTASGMGSVLEWLRTKIFKPKGKRSRWSPFYCCYIEHEMDPKYLIEYPSLMSVLLQRYLNEKYLIDKRRLPS